MQRVLAASPCRRPVVLKPRRCSQPRRSVRVLAYMSPSLAPDLQSKVHAWFDNILRDEQPIDHLLAPNATLTDHLNEACYKGPAQIKHRLLEFHQSHLQCNLTELGTVTDLDHNKVCAHWACSPKPGCDDTTLYGSNVFTFNDEGLISHIVIAENPTFATIRNPKWEQAKCSSSQ